jgi:fibrillarin-like pre-rRNA processing protein
MDGSSLIRRDRKLFTKDAGDGRSVYGEELTEIEGSLFREWIPWRSKMAALLKKREDLPQFKGNVLYLGAAQGTTVSHLSDILEDGTIFAVEFSQVAFRKLSSLAKKRKNIVPILADALHPERYLAMIPSVEIIYQDVSQKDQVGILLKNAAAFLSEGGFSFLMLKARSVDVTAKPERIFERASEELSSGGFEIIAFEDLSPFQADHAAIIARYRR